MWLARSGRNSRRGNHPHLARARALHDACTRLERGAGRADVIHEDHRQARQRRRHTVPQPDGPVPRVPPPERERAVHVGMPFPGGKIDLWKSAAHPPEQAADGKTQVSRQQLGLIEAPPVTPRPVQRHRQSDVRTSQYVGAMIAHQAAKPWGDRLTPAVLERMDDVAQRAVVTADGEGAIDGASPSRAVSTHACRAGVGPSRRRRGDRCTIWRLGKRGRDTCWGVGSREVSRPLFLTWPVETLAEGRQGVTAPIAEGRCGRPDRRPATLANGAVPEMLENRAAGGARRREQHQRSGLGRSREAAREAPPRVRQARRAR